MVGDVKPKRPRLIDYFRVKSLWDEISDEELEGHLWAPAGEGFDGDGDMVIAQYSLYVEMADRISQRRGQANTFFLSIHTGAFVLLAGWLQGDRDLDAFVAVVLAVALVASCMTWFWTIRSYRQLNSAKWRIVGLIERRLPIRPWGKSEWTALGEGNDPGLYWQLTAVEMVIPFVFAVAYILAIGWFAIA